MKFRQTSKSSIPFINITSLVDVVFILLIFFVVSTTFFYAGGIKVDLPKAATTLENNSKEMVRITVTNDNRLFMGDSQLAETDLDETLKQAYDSNSEATLVIEADTNSLHGIVVRVIDAGKLAGFEKFAIATEEPAEKQ